MSTAKKATTKVVTGIVRLSYANVWEPASINGSKPKYSVSLIIPKGDTKTIADTPQWNLWSARTVEPEALSSSMVPIVPADMLAD